MTRLPTACVIGAGSSGIAAAKALHERGIPFDVLRDVRPRRRQLGVRQPQRDVVAPTGRCTSTRRASAWSTRTSRCRSRYPDFPHHTQIAAVLRRLRRPLRLPRQDPLRDRRRARRARRRRRLGGHDRRGRDARLRRAARRQRPPLGPALARAGVPRADTFDGEQMHAHHYIDDEQLAARACVVLGMGNSAMDIAVEASYDAHRTSSSPRAAAPTCSRSTCSASPLDQIGVNSPPRGCPWRGPPARSSSALYRLRRRQGRGLRPAQARPQARRGAPDDLRPTSSTASPTAR